MEFETMRSIGTVFLVIVFVWFGVWLFSPKRKKFFEEAGQIPLDDSRPSVANKENTK